MLAFAPPVECPPPLEWFAHAMAAAVAAGVPCWHESGRPMRRPGRLQSAMRQILSTTGSAILKLAAVTMLIGLAVALPHHQIALHVRHWPGAFTLP